MELGLLFSDWVYVYGDTGGVCLSVYPSVCQMLAISGESLKELYRTQNVFTH